MSTCSLTLLPFKKQSMKIELSDRSISRSAVEQIIDSFSNGNCVFANLSYEFELNVQDIAVVRDVRVYINDAYEPSKYSNGIIRFPTDENDDKKIFQDCYGYVELSLSIVMDDGTEKHLTSEYLSVLVERGQLNEAVKAMVSYVYNHQELLLLNGKPKARNQVGLKESNNSSLAAQIILAEEIATVYESSYGYFKVNGRFQIEKVPVVEQFERLQYVTPSTLQYIASHPEQLKSVSAESGIRIRNRVYQPQKTLSLQSVNSYDIYENRVILGFLRKMVDDVVELKTKCEQLLQRIPSDEDYSAEYIYSSFFMFSETRRTLEDGIQKLHTLYDKFTKLWVMYQTALSIPQESVSRESLSSAPRPTAVFMSVSQYNIMFIHIHQWYSFGLYDFEKEDFMLSFVNVSSLYESYLLTKMIAYLENRGYKLHDGEPHHYKLKSTWKHKNTRHTNTFRFSSETTSLTLYYQPVIFITDQKYDNGIGLYKNNTISVDTGEDGADYYVPDYLIKVECGGVSKYLIIDAKFSSYKNVKKYYVKALAFKYLFSISPIEDIDCIIGMCIMYGKCTDKDDIHSAYDKQLPGSVVAPIFEILPLIEGITTNKQYSKLDLLFQKFLG